MGVVISHKLLDFISKTIDEGSYKCNEWKEPAKISTITFMSNSNVNINPGEHGDLYVTSLDIKGNKILYIYNREKYEINILTSDKFYMPSDTSVISMTMLDQIAYNLDLSNVSFSNSYNLSGLFKTTRFNVLNLGNFSITDEQFVFTDNMFSNCRIDNLIYNKFEIKNIRSAKSMFENAYIGSRINVGGIDLSKCKSARSMFADSDIFSVINLDKLFNSNTEFLSMFDYANLHNSILNIDTLQVNNENIDKYDRIFCDTKMYIININKIITDNISLKEIHSKFGNPHYKTIYRRPIIIDTVHEEPRKYEQVYSDYISKHMDKLVYCVDYTHNFGKNGISIARVILRDKDGVLTNLSWDTFKSEIKNHKIVLANPYHLIDSHRVDEESFMRLLLSSK